MREFKVGGSARKTNKDYTGGTLAEIVDILISEHVPLFISAVSSHTSAFVSNARYRLECQRNGWSINCMPMVSECRVHASTYKALIALSQALYVLTWSEPLIMSPRHWR